jgi:hypothetical protein
MTMESTLPGPHEVELNAELAALDAAHGAEGVSADYLRFSASMACAQSKARSALRASAGSEFAVGKGDRGRLLTPEEVPFDDRVLLDLLREMERASEGAGRKVYVQSLLRAAEEDSRLLGGLAVAATLGRDARPLQDAAYRLGLPTDALALLARLLAAPFLVEARHRRGPMPELDVRGEDAGNEWEAGFDTPIGFCPTCAAGAGLALLRPGDGARRLICLLCGEAWLAPRLMCTSCGTRDQSKLGMLCVAEDDPRWIEVCDVCRRYLKTIDQRLLPEGYVVVPRAEDARTLHLDLIAEKEGYGRPAL